VEELVPPGNPLRPRALAYLLGGAALTTVLMASDVRTGVGVELATAALAAAAFGALDLAGYFDDAPRGEVSAVTVPWRRVGELGLASLLCLLSLRLAVAGALPRSQWTAPLLVTLTSFCCLLSLGRCLTSFGGAPWQSRAGFWLMLLGLGLYLPLLGGHSLLDPWETHYGEVAREMLARDDWLSLWWAQDGWFWSKPALTFWLQGLSFAALGVRFRPDELLASAAEGRLPQPEWAARLPIALLSLISVYCFYRFVAKAAGTRAGWLSGLLLLCAPYWSLLSHQGMTDMPYVAALTAALSLFGLARLADPEELAPSLRVALRGRHFSVSACHALLALVLLSSLPQVCYLLSRNVTLQLAAPPYGFRFHLDELFAGSGLYNCGLPGNQPCRGAQPANVMFQPALGAALFGGALGYLVHLNRGERRLKRVLYLGAWYFTALSALAKGAPGLVLPLLIVLVAVCASRRWAELERVELAGLGLIFAAITLPWYVQSYMRHGEPFTDRLLFHDMYKRAFVHVHDTNAGTDTSIRYYLWQLGYGLFPWTGAALVGVGQLLEHTGKSDERRRELGTITVLWLGLAFALFTVSLTKFHHYALPCTPPLALAAGLWLDRSWGSAPLGDGRRLLGYWLGLLASGGLLLYAALLFAPGGWAGPFATAPLAAVGCAVLGVGALWLAVRGHASRAPHDSALALLAFPAALVTLLVTRDLSRSYPGDVAASARLLHLITYNYKRSWPESLDFEGVGFAFGVVTALSTALAASARLRAHAARLTCVVAVCFCAFTLWVYLPRLAPHFGQRELLLTYYRARQGPEQPLVAYQMNWKGENFYSGNRVAAFVSSGAKLERYLDSLRSSGRLVVFFIVEHGRIGTLKSELGSAATLERLTDKADSDKFALLRVALKPRT
jgi:4-amino-4-deoxy-L-arabinose transferase-like glycosyltransferase